MKKITFFLFSLLCALGAMAQDGPTITTVTRVSADITEGKWYIMEQLRGGVGYLFENEDHALRRKPSNTEASTLANANVNNNKTALVRFVKDDGTDVNTYKIQLASGYYFKQPTHNTSMRTTNIIDEYGHFHINKVEKSDGSYTFQFGTKSTGGILIDTKANSANGTTVEGWGSDNTGNNGSFKSTVDGTVGNNEWKVYEVTFSDDLAQVEVNLKENESSETTTPYKYNLGRLPVGMTLSPLRNYIAPVSGLINISDGDATVTNNAKPLELTYTEKVPFAASYEKLETNQKWTSIYTGNARMYVYEEGQTGGYRAIDNATFMGLSDNCFWGFICKDPVNEPVYIVNKAAGQNKYLQMLANGKFGNNSDQNANKPCVMVSVTNENDLATAERVGWMFKQATQHPSGNYSEDFSHFFGIKNLGTNQYMNNFAGNGYMTSWTDDASTDRGSGCKLTPERETYVTLGQRALTAPEGAVHSLKSECREILGTSEALAGKTLVELRAIVSTHNDNANGKHGTVQMENNGYYRLLNWAKHDEPANAKVISYGINNGNSSRALEVMNENEVNQIWKAEQGSDANEFRFYNVNAGKYLNDPQTAALNENAITFALTDLGAGQHFVIANGRVLKGNMSGDNLNGIGYENTSGTYRKNTADAWYIMPVKDNFEITLNNGGDGSYYATACYPFAIRLEGATAYVMDGYTTKGEINLTEVTEVPANTGIVVVGNGAKATVTILNETTETTTGHLSGTNTDKAFDTSFTKENVLVLGMGATSQKVGFYRPSAASTKVRHNSAYLDTTELTGVNTASGFVFNFGGEQTDIQTVANGENDRNVVYDLQGRRVTAPSKGVYIINGKKVIR